MLYFSLCCPLFASQSDACAKFDKESFSDLVLKLEDLHVKAPSVVGNLAQEYTQA